MSENFIALCTECPYSRTTKPGASARARIKELDTLVQDAKAHVEATGHTVTAAGRMYAKRTCPKCNKPMSAAADHCDDCLFRRAGGRT